MTQPNKLEKRLYWAMRFILAGLVVELFSLFGLKHPMGFMTFAAFGCTLMIVGTVLFLVTLLSSAKGPDPKALE